MRQNKLLRRFLFLFTFILVGLPLYRSYSYGIEVICAGKSLPQLTLNTPNSAEEKQYLGLKNLNSFTISQIPSKIILIEVFSFYCPICHKQAPIANKLYRLIQQNPELSKDIKMIGIGAGNNRKETEAYKTNFRVPFPLFCDPDFKIHKKFGEPRTPLTILTNRNGKVLLTHFGVIEDVDEFLSKINKFHKQL